MGTNALKIFYEGVKQGNCFSCFYNTELSLKFSWKLIYFDVKVFDWNIKCLRQENQENF